MMEVDINFSFEVKKFHEYNFMRCVFIKSLKLTHYNRGEKKDKFYKKREKSA